MKVKIKRNNILIWVGLIAGGMLLGALIFGSSGSEGKTGKTTEVHNHENHEGEETIWTCSMHPQIRQDEPGDCPICGMELIPAAEEKSEVDPEAFKMTETAMKLANIQTSKVQTGKPEKKIRLTGKIAVDERLVTTQAVHFPGRIEKLYLNFKGENVNKGQTIARVYSPELIAAQRELFEALKTRETNPDLFDAAKNKLRQWKITETQVDEIIKNGEIKEILDVRANTNGIVHKKLVNEGDYVKKGAMLYHIAQIDRVWVMFDVYQEELPFIEEGDKIHFTVSSAPGKSFESKISFIDPIMDSKSRVAKIRTETRNRNGLLKPGMFADGTLISDNTGTGDELIIPKSSVMWTGKRSVVYVKQPGMDQPFFKMREIVPGPSLGDRYIVEKGLEAGEEIVTYGTFAVDAAAQLGGRPSMMNPGADKSSTGHDHGNMRMDESEAHSKNNIKNALIKHETFKVSGNCQMCKNTIEKAATSLPGVNTANWNIESKMLHVSFNAEKSSLSDIHKAIAKSGYDTERETAPKEAYDNLPACCQYTRASGENTKSNVKHTTFRVSGNCGMCKTRIEEAALALDGVTSANWDEETKMMHLSFHADKVKEIEIHKAIAKAGHDTEKEKAPKDVYNELPECCKYSR